MRKAHIANIRRKLGGMLLAIGVAVTGTIAVDGTAHAASNGQQLLLINNSGSTKNWGIIGQDQNGNWESTCVAATGNETWLSGWWWKGSVTINAWVGDYGCSSDSNYANDGLAHQYTVNIPQTSSNDWQAVVDGGDGGSDNQQVVFYDNKHMANSIYIQGFNQNHQWAQRCWSTPSWKNQLSGWWWSAGVQIDTYSGSSCDTGHNGTFYSEGDAGAASSVYFAVTD